MTDEEKAKGARLRAHELLGLRWTRGDCDEAHPTTMRESCDRLTAYIESAMLAETVHVTEYAALKAERDALSVENARLKEQVDQARFDGFHDARHLRLMARREMYNTIKLLSVELDAVHNSTKGDKLAALRVQLDAALEGEHHGSRCKPLLRMTGKRDELREQLEAASALLGRWMVFASGVAFKSLYGEQVTADTSAFLASPGLVGPAGQEEEKQRERCQQCDSILVLSCTEGCEAIEKCESGCAEPVTRHDVDGVPLCEACYQALDDEPDAAGLVGPGAGTTPKQELRCGGVCQSNGDALCMQPCIGSPGQHNCCACARHVVELTVEAPAKTAGGDVPGPSRESAQATEFKCPTCGPGVVVDEDGCCAQCGRDTSIGAVPGPRQEGTPPTMECCACGWKGTADDTGLGAVLNCPRCYTGKWVKSIGPAAPATPQPETRQCWDCRHGVCQWHAFVDSLPAPPQPETVACDSRYNYKRPDPGEWTPLARICMLPRGHEGPHGPKVREEVAAQIATPSHSTTVADESAVGEVTAESAPPPPQRDSTKLGPCGVRFHWRPCCDAQRRIHSDVCDLPAGHPGLAHGKKHEHAAEPTKPGPWPPGKGWRARYVPTGEVRMFNGERNTSGGYDIVSVGGEPMGGLGPGAFGPRGDWERVDWPAPEPTPAQSPEAPRLCGKTYTTTIERRGGELVRSCEREAGHSGTPCGQESCCVCGTPIDLTEEGPTRAGFGAWRCEGCTRRELPEMDHAHLFSLLEMEAEYRRGWEAARAEAAKGILADIRDEAERGARLFPKAVDYPDGTRDGGMNLIQREQAKNACDRAEREGRCTFAHVLAEEFWEAMCEENPAGLRGELVQVAAVALQWIRNLDARLAALPSAQEG